MKVLYTIWCFFWLILIFLVLFPGMFLCLQREKWKPYAHRLNRLWGQLFFPLAGIRLTIEYRSKPDPQQTYVFCANHFSYLDIAVMGVILEHYFAFVGKADVKDIPLFGYMFKKLHIQVNRDSTQSRVSSLNRAIKTLAQGRSIMVFPEGGIKTKQPPQMHRPFMDGAFRMAIQQQVPIVPISLLTNYKILPDVHPIRMHGYPMQAIVHEAIPTVGLTPQDVLSLRDKCFGVIDDELKKHLSPENKGSKE